ncbi:hypothetical protein BR93DRAFT_883057 [Coniochaeta sp. PMI_546]|nr:hypothetical protein BR93DRAFT_883057 [Coniochaeta sp. PMI_546]
MFNLLSFLTLILSITPCEASPPNPKRGLVFVESPDPAANSIWLQSGSPLTWYYNYMFNVSDTFASASQQDFEFVPMYWGAGDVNDTSFLANITTLVKNGLNITHVLGFNQPDLAWSDGGSNLAPKDAARLWINNFLPLQELGIKIGLPVVKAQRDPGNWTVPFLNNCTALIRNETGDQAKNCSFDFVPIHAFGNMSALTSRVETFAKTFPGKPIWITEYADNDQDLATTQTFFNASLKYLDSSDVVERYAYFGSFRADVSNVGPNAAMLDPYNRLTDIGSWYLGGNSTGNPPTYSTGGSGQGAGGTGGSSNSSCTAAHPCGQGNRATTSGLAACGFTQRIVAALLLALLVSLW